MGVPNHVLLARLKDSLVQDNKIIKSKFLKQRDSEYVARIKSESVYLKATIKAIEKDRLHNMSDEWQVWAKFHIEWAKAMHTIYSRESLKDGSFHAHCTNLRRKRDNALSSLNERT